MATPLSPRGTVGGRPPPPPGLAPSLPPDLAEIAPPPPPPDHDPDMASPAQVAELQEFLKWKDPTKPADFAERILSMFKLVDVAEAIRDRFGMLPQGWRAYVKSDQISRDLPRGLSREKFDVDLSKEDAKNKSASDFRIDEIIDTEERFVAVITEAQNKFVDELYAILARNSTKAEKEAVKALGLTQEELNSIFEPLPHIVRFSQALLSKLEIISLVRKQPLSGEGRAIHVGQAFIDMAPKLHVYAPAISSYQASLNTLNEAVNRIKANPPKHGETFMDIWDELVKSNEVLRGQQLQSVLIQPMQRVPRYKMLLEVLIKDIDSVDALPVCKQALDLISSAASSINGAVKSHEKLADFFGAAGELKPMTSTATTAKNGKGIKIQQNYNAGAASKLL